MRAWTENDSQTYREIADVAVPHRDEMVATLVAAVPFAADDPVKMLELGSGDGRLADALLTKFPLATLTALDGSDSMRREALFLVQSLFTSNCRWKEATSEKTPPEKVHAPSSNC